MVEIDPGGKNASPIKDGRNTPVIVITARWLFILLGTIWLVFGVFSITRIGSLSSSVPPVMLWIIAILMLVNALLFFWIGWGIGRGNRLYFYFGLILLAGNIFLTFTDEFGSFDLITLIINIVLLVLLIVGHSKFLTE
jgi:hypothetical protein